MLHGRFFPNIKLFLSVFQGHAVFANKQLQIADKQQENGSIHGAINCDFFNRTVVCISQDIFIIVPARQKNRVVPAENINIDKVKEWSSAE